MNIEDAQRKFERFGRLKHITVVKSQGSQDRKFHHESDDFQIMLYPGTNGVIDVPPGTVFVKLGTYEFIVGEP